jgi:CHAT domain-containing protein/Tfp pilus assembly protein PilF
MISRLFRFLSLLLGCFTFWPCLGFADSAPEETSQPSAAVVSILDEATRLVQADQLLESLTVSDRAFELGRQTDDPAGQALAREVRGDALERLQRVEEAAAAWQDASHQWARSGDIPRQIRTLVHAALICVPPRNGDAELLAQGLSSLQLESRDPGALAQALHESGVELADHGLNQSAVDYLRVALELREKQSPQSRELAETLVALARLMFFRGVKRDSSFVCLARGYCARAFEIGQRVAPGTPVVVQSLLGLGNCERELDRTDPAARDHFLEALRIQRGLAPDGSLKEASILADLGMYELELSDRGVAREHIEEAVALGEQFGPRSRVFEVSLEDLSTLEGSEGDPFKERALLERALTINQALHGDLGPTYINLGEAAMSQYDFAAARAYLERALAIFQESAPEGKGVLFAFGDLAITFHREGDLASALDYETRAIAGMAGTPELPEYYLEMGEILRDQRKFDRAASYFHQAIDIFQSWNPENQALSAALADLASVERARGNRAEAMNDLRRALQIGQKDCPTGWCAVGVLNDLGQVAYEQGDLATAEGYLREAVDLREKSLGPTHPDLARSLNDLALVVAASGNPAKAREEALRAEGIGAEHLRLSARTLSERQALAYEGIRASGLDVALSIGTDGADALGRVSLFDAVIRSRALVFDELAARQRSTYGSGDPEVAQLADQLSAARRRLATLVFRGVGESTPETYRVLVDNARQNKETAERKLAEKSAAFRQDQARAQLGYEEVASSLPDNSALIAFVRYSRHDFRKTAPGRTVRQPIPSYAAFVLRSGEREPQFIRLGTAREIETSLSAWRRDIARQAELLDETASRESASRVLGAALRRRIWDPLQFAIGDAQEVFVVPDAALHLVNIASLPFGGSRYLVEAGPLMHYLSTERDLVPSPSRSGDGILVVGNPAFDRTSTLTLALNRPSPLRGMTTRAPETAYRGARSACGSFRTLRFPPLPASEKEARDIAALWNTSASGDATSGGVGVQHDDLLEVTGIDASREAFELSAPGKRVLHVATHGFFLEGKCESAVQRADADKNETSPLPATVESPLLLSGLAFAGANRRAAAGPDESDGILTAEEIAGINLDGVDWAVLSACDTGVGKIKVGEGVFGLRRAFQLAGARTVIMSLWPIEDESTREWMATLYKEHFRGGKNTPEAVRAATLRVLRQRRAKHLSTHPFYWGAFIAAGDWH